MSSSSANGVTPLSSRRSSMLLDLDPNTEIFGVTLSKAMSLDEGRTLLPSQEIPTLLDLILCNLEIKVTDSEVFANADPDSDAVNKLRDSLNKGMLPATINGETDVLSGLLRRYLRELPEPLVPVSFFKPLATLLTSSKKFKNGKDRGGIAAVKEIVESNEFPVVNYHALRRVCGLLRSMLTSWWSDSGEGGKILDIMSLNILRPDNLKRAASTSKEFSSIKDAVSNLILHSAAIFVRSSVTDSQARRISMIKRGEKASRHHLLDVEDAPANGTGPESARSRRLSSFSVADAFRVDAELRAEFRTFKETTNTQIQILTETVEALRLEVDVLRKRLMREGSDTFASAHGSDVDDSEPPEFPLSSKRSNSSSKILPPKKKSSVRSLDGVERKNSKNSIETGLTSKKDSKKSLKG